MTRRPLCSPWKWSQPRGAAEGRWAPPSGRPTSLVSRPGGATSSTPAPLHAPPRFSRLQDPGHARRAHTEGHPRKLRSHQGQSYSNSSKMERQQDHPCRLRLRGLPPCHRGALRSLHWGRPRLRTLKGGAQPPVHPRRRPDLSRRLQSPKASLHQRDLPSPTSPRWSNSCAWRTGASKTSLRRGRSRLRSFGMTFVFASWFER